MATQWNKVKLIISREYKNLSFEPWAHIVFNSVELVEKLDALAKVSIKTGGEGFGDKWKLGKIEFTAVNPTTNEALAAKQVFAFDQWISAKKVYECAPLGADGQSPAGDVYTIEVKTSNKLFAGTDNDVYINVQGTKGQTQFRKLSNKYHNDFEQGKTDSFEIKAINLGKKLQLNTSRILYRIIPDYVGLPNSGY